MIAFAVVVAYSLELAARRKRALRTVLEHNLEEVAVPIVVDREAAEAVHMEVVHMEVVEVAVPNLAVGLDHKTRIIPPVGYSFFFIAPFEANVQYHTTGVKANRQG